MAATRGSRVATCRGVNPRFTSLRSWVCRGGSWLSMSAPAPPSPSAGSWIIVLGCEPNCWGWRETVTTSS